MPKAKQEARREIEKDPKLRLEAGYKAGYVSEVEMENFAAKDAKNAASIEMVEKRIEASQALQTERLKYLHELQLLRMQNASGGGGKDSTPAAILTAKWLMENKDNPVAMSAFRMANKTNDDEGGLAAKIYTQDHRDGRGKMTPDDAKAVASQFRPPELSLASPTPVAPNTNAPKIPYSAPKKPFNPNDFRK
jgi:hypothetical protein